MARHWIYLFAWVGLILAGCANEQWYKTGVKEEERDADLQACQDFAHAQVRKEEEANPPTPAEGESTGSQSEQSTSLSLNLEHYNNRHRYDDLVDACMTGNGYAKK